MTANEFIKIAKEFDVSYADIRSFVEVETEGKGFYDDGDPIILFEGHWFYKLLPEPLKSQTAKNWPNLCYPKWTKIFYKFSSRKRLAYAIKINKRAALMSCSWGLMQVMGFNWSDLGYKSIEDFVSCMYESEYEQVKAGILYLKKNNILKYIKEENWHEVFRRYNGEGYKENNYDKKFLAIRPTYQEQEKQFKQEGLL